MKKNVLRSTLSLYQWIWQSYLRTALIPLVLVELVFIAIYFFTNSWSQSEIVSYLRKQAQEEMLQIANREANVIQQQLSSISNGTELYRRQNEKALSKPALLSPEDAKRLSYSPKGVYYTTSDTEAGGAAIFYSGYVPIGEKERDKVARLLATQTLMKDIKESQPLAASLYLNTFDSLNIIYPYFDVLSQYETKMNIPQYNFYYEADQKHNPEHKVKWTDAYLDPAGHGWMASAIAPVYNGDFLEGVVGIDITVSTIISQILKMEIPYEGYGILIGNDGNILALPEKGEADWGLNELTDHHYEEAIKHNTFKPDQFNLYKRENLGPFAENVKGKTSGVSGIQINGKNQVASWSTINETGWKLLIIVPEKNVYARVDIMMRKLFEIGTFMVAGLVIFYSIFFFILSKKARKMSSHISQPLVEINGMAQKIGEGDYYQDEPDMHVSELKNTASCLVKMGEHLGEANKNLLDTQEKLRKSEADLRGLVNSLDDVILEVNEQGAFTSVWSKDQNKLAKPYLEGSSHTIDTIFDSATAECYKAKIKHVLETEAPDSIEYRLETNKGFRWFQGRISLVDKDTRTVVISARDITERKEIENSLIAAKEEAEKANKAKSQFLSSMSHELRTPLNAVLGFAQVLEMDPEAPLSEMQSQSVNEILKAGNHLLSLINEVLDLAKVESGKLTLSIEPIQIQPIIEETLALIKPLADQYKIKINTPSAECNKNLIAVDRTRIKQVLINLLTNAIKYNKENGEVTFYCEKIDDKIRIHVIDTGYGIDESELDAIFKPFHRISNINRTVEGTGIGLTVAKQFIELMQGRIGLNSQIGEGSHFWIDLPCAEITK